MPKHDAGVGGEAGEVFIAGIVHGQRPLKVIIIISGGREGGEVPNKSTVNPL